MSMEKEADGPAVDEAVRTLLLLMPRLVGRAKRLPIPAALQGLELAPRHLALLAHLEYDGPTSVNELAARLEVAPTTVSLMVSELSRPGVLQRTTDPADRRRRIIAIAPAYTAPISEWLSGSASAWESVMRELDPAGRATVIGALRAFEAALEQVSERHRNAK
ncbi:MarR family winged helix-turn-helix transcriptional regulator [Actinomadura sp. ATCC 31491]|uniref:MarR family winged helix-turn-helix transcriptional regulator n=1 Tax=Actinomadura luzonensis TaxID=2805427 RepID=A0ABT0G107_9ACTN|nr:helix-turn-helix domain-containing protein [Actinomadura luzonensis]MCK2218219.1 MarR family winged helix-turn-helix transcriptional regulator [Actinomadura luzonensis]